VTRIMIGWMALGLAWLFATGSPLMAAERDRVMTKDGEKNVWVVSLDIDKVGLGMTSASASTVIKAEDFVEVIEWGSVPTEFAEGYTAYRAGDFAKAKQRMEYVREDDLRRPPHKQYRNFVLAESCRALGKMDEALAYYAKIQDKEFFYPQAMFGIGRIYMAQGKMD